MRLLLKILGGVALLLIIALAVFIGTFDVNKYKPEVISLVKEKTGRSFDIKGDLKLGYALIPTVIVDGASFGNASWGSQPEMARVGHFEAKFALLPLLSGNISVNRLVLSEAEIYLETNKNGVGNWQLEMPAGKAGKPQPENAPAKPAKMPAFNINEVLIRNSRITYRDGVSGKTTLAGIEEFSVTTAGIAQPMKLSLKAAYNDIPLEASGTLGSLDSITANKSSPLNVNLKVKDVLLTLDGKIDKPMQGKGMDADISLEAPSLDTFAKISGKKLPAIGPLHIAGHVSEREGSYLIQALQAEAGKTRLSLDGKITPAQPLKLALTVNLAADSLADVNDIAGTKLPDIKPLSLSTKLSDKDGGYQLQDTSLKLGNSDLAGNATINIKNERPALAATLSSNMLDLVPFAGGKKEEAQKAKKTKVFPSAALPFESLKAADLNMDIKAQQIKSADLIMQNVHLIFSLVNGKLAIKPLNANIGGGSLALQMNLDAGSGKTGVLDTKIDVKNFEPSTLPDLKDQISGGKTDIALTAKGTGKSVAAIMAGLNGSLLMKMGPGILKSSKANVATSDMLVSTYQLLYPGAKGSKDTEIQCGVVKFDIKDGIATTDKGIAFATNKMNIIGSGVVDLKTEKLDIGINPQAHEGVGISPAQLAELVRIGGTLAEPKAVPDTIAALKTAASVGTAVATGGLSLIVQGLPDKSSADPDPCATALGVKPKAGTTTTQKEEAPKSTTEKAVDTIKDTGSAIGDKLKSLFK